MLTPRMMDRYDTKAELFDDFYQFVLGYGVELLLPCIIGVIAAMLFFMERDNDTGRNNLCHGDLGRIQPQMLAVLYGKLIFVESTTPWSWWAYLTGTKSSFPNTPWV